MSNTLLGNLIDPQVMADIITGKIEDAIQVLPYARLDTTLQGQAGGAITLPKFGYIGDAVVVAEGADIPIRTLECTSESYEVKKVGAGIVLTDEAVLSGYGNPVGEAINQLAKSVLAATDSDSIAALYGATTTVAGDGVISYANIVKAIDGFNEEINTQKVIFVHPHQVTQLRNDEDFKDASQYGSEVMMNGEIGMIANCRVIASRKIGGQHSERDAVALVEHNAERSGHIIKSRGEVCKPDDAAPDRHNQPVGWRSACSRYRVRPRQAAYGTEAEGCSLIFAKPKPSRRFFRGHHHPSDIAWPARQRYFLSMLSSWIFCHINTAFAATYL